MYIRPIFLWSTVVPQSCNTSSQMRRGALWSMPAVTGAWVAIRILRTLLQGHQIRGYGVEVVVVEMHRRHQRSGFEVGGVLHKGANVFRGVGYGPGCDGIATGFLGERRETKPPATRPT